MNKHEFYAKINTSRNQNSNFSEDPNYEVLLLEHIKRYN